MNDDDYTLDDLVKDEKRQIWLWALLFAGAAGFLYPHQWSYACAAIATGTLYAALRTTRRGRAR